MKDLEPSLLKGFLLCIFDAEAVRLQTSQWKRNLLVCVSGVGIEISALPHLSGWMGYASPELAGVLTAVFLPLGLVGLYASKFGSDRLVESLLVVPELTRMIFR
jgi:hypothetical protein